MIVGILCNCHVKRFCELAFYFPWERDLELKHNEYTPKDMHAQSRKNCKGKSHIKGKVLSSKY